MLRISVSRAGLGGKMTIMIVRAGERVLCVRSSPVYSLTRSDYRMCAIGLGDAKPPQKFLLWAALGGIAAESGRKKKFLEGLDLTPLPARRRPRKFCQLRRRQWQSFRN